MLRSLQIDNFALIDHLALEFGSGLHVLTGETGAGKSIILDAIDAVLGGKVGRRAVRSGESSAQLSAAFAPPVSLVSWLESQDLPCREDGMVVCQREISLSGTTARSRTRVNGALVNRTQIEELRRQLVEITAQGQTVHLGLEQRQREWLDHFGGKDLLQKRDRVADAYDRFQQARKTLEQRRQLEAERLQQLDLFDYQARELAAADLSDPQELELLKLESDRLSHSVELQQQSYQVYQVLYANDSGADASADLLGKAEGILQDMVRYDPQLQDILELVSSALAQVEEAGHQINAYGESVETDPQRLQEIQTRIQVLKQICRKYGPSLAEAIAHQQQLQKALDQLNGKGQSLEDLEHTYQEKQTVLQHACQQLTRLREQSAQTLQTRLVHELKPLAMDKVQFHVALTPTTATATGCDHVSFQFSPNPGEPLQPLMETASGGEMSRFLLALKACFSQVDPVGTLIFDEIDVGVSGRVAQAIAEKLYQLSQHHQVLCVTHQPLVAAMADHHYRVTKQVIDPTPPIQEMPPEATKRSKSRRRKKATEDESGPSASSTAAEKQELTSESSLEPQVRTVVRIMPLNAEQRREELAQLAGGQNAQEAIAFAESLLTQAHHLREK